MEREVRYCTTDDGVRIAYSVEGDGPPLLVCSMWFDSFAYTITGYDQFQSKLAKGRQLLRYDTRGIGLSDRQPADVRGQALVLDIEAVARSCDLHRFAIFAAGLAGPKAIAFAAAHPEDVSHLILFETYANPRDVHSPELVASFAQLARTNWDMASQMFADVSLRETFPDAALEAMQHTRRSVTGDMLARFFEEAYPTSDSGPFLTSVKAKTLVLHRVDDRGFPFAGGQRIAAEIPGAELVPLEGNVSYYFLGETRTSLKAINRFLGDPGVGRRTPVIIDETNKRVSTVLFTDLVGHAEMMSRLGDVGGRAILREHERITRNVLKQHGGTEVKTMGDGFMASFGSVTKAVECAVALQRAFAEREGEPLSVRVGLNAGEPIEEDGDLFGATVILASRIAAKAEGGEILVADTVRGLCSGKGFLFADRGEFVAKGFEEPVRVYEVRWRE